MIKNTIECWFRRIPTNIRKNNIQFSSITELNGNQHFNFKDDNHQIFDIYSNELNVGIGLGTPTFESAVNPLHQIQGWDQ